MHISEFDYELPEELIAQYPLERRDASRMLVVNRVQETWFDSEFLKMPEQLQSNDIVVINNTRVFPARLLGQRDPSGGHVEVLLLRQLAPLHWEALVRPGQRLKQGARLRFGPADLCAEMLDVPGHEVRQIRLFGSESLEKVLDEIGQVPLPPYIKRASGTISEDRERYQTIFARERGAIAAPTAGLHFTSEALAQVRARGALITEVTLHVGYGTFEPVRVEEVGQHQVASEVFGISTESANAINTARRNGGRVIAVGTTTTRALEAAANTEGKIAAQKSSTTLTISPGYKFRSIDALLTNFHLPCSSLLLLVCAFAGRDLVLSAYQHAIDAGYRFYSYGDCMLII
jgi:S-adenosylmethionine:tRNA ribosyltransferase-isomerase